MTLRDKMGNHETLKYLLKGFVYLCCGVGAWVCVSKCGVNELRKSVPAVKVRSLPKVS